MDNLTDFLSKTHLQSVSGVSFAGKALKLNTEEDAKEIVKALDECKNLEYFNLEGNTLGIDAGKVIGKSLESHPEFKRALWKDMFTGRMKDEIPIALEHLGNGIVKSTAQLIELDLSDNAFGPIGVQGLASLLKSSCCYALQELRLNNNGLGITGGKLLANALLDCYKSSKDIGKPLSLKVFIAGRNRLENDGATALANVFKMLGTLEEIQMPQNGIYHEGISALSNAFEFNNNLTILNLNDNTIGPEGAKALSIVLPSLHSLKTVNFGDCLLKTKGVQYLANGLKDCENLEEVILNFNEIRVAGATDLIKAFKDKGSLKAVNLNGNIFGVCGINLIKRNLKDIGKVNVLENLDEDEGDTDEEEEISSEDEENDTFIQEEVSSTTKLVTVEEFLGEPSPQKFIDLGGDRNNVLLKAAMKKSENYIETYLNVLMNVTSITTKCGEPTRSIAIKSAELLYKEIFSWAQQNDKVPVLNNTILVYLGLLKSEDKKFKPKWETNGCLEAIGLVADKNYFPESTKDTLKVFLNR